MSSIPRAHSLASHNTLLFSSLFPDAHNPMQHSRTPKDEIHVDDECISAGNPHAYCEGFRQAHVRSTLRPSCMDNNSTVDSMKDCYDSQGNASQHCMAVRLAGRHTNSVLVITKGSMLTRCFLLTLPGGVSYKCVYCSVWRKVRKRSELRHVPRTAPSVRVFLFRYGARCLRSSCYWLIETTQLAS